MVGMNFDGAGLSALSRDECLDLLSRSVIGRVVFTSAALPAVQPVNYAVDIDGAIVIRTARDSRLAAAVNNAVVAFEVDDFDVAARAGWSVIVTGRARLVRDPVELTRVQALPLEVWAGGPRTEFIRIAPEIVSGRRVTPAPVAV